MPFIIYFEYIVFLIFIGNDVVILFPELTSLCKIFVYFFN